MEQIDEVTVPEAVRILEDEGIDFSQTKMRGRIRDRKISAEKRGRDWWISRAELDRILEAEAKT